MKSTDHAFSDMLTTQDMTGCCGAQSAESKIDKAEEKNHRNASEYNAGANYGKKKTTTEMKDAGGCAPSMGKKKSKKKK